MGDADSSLRQIKAQSARLAGQKAFADHHAYDARDVIALDATAAASGAPLMVPTEKDWARLASMPEALATKIPIWRVQLALRFRAGDDAALLSSILARCPAGQSTPEPTFRP